MSDQQLVWIALLALSVLTNCGGSLAGRQGPRLLIEEYLKTDTGQCEAMKSSVARECASLGYNTTRMPNLLNYHKQREALQQFLGFRPLLTTQCSTNLRFLLCMFYFPSCSSSSSSSTAEDGVFMVTPCREVCQSVRNACRTLLERFGVQWSEALDCERLMTANKPYYRGLGGEKIVCVNSAQTTSLKRGRGAESTGNNINSLDNASEQTPTSLAPGELDFLPSHGVCLVCIPSSCSRCFRTRGAARPRPGPSVLCIYPLGLSVER